MKATGKIIGRLIVGCVLACCLSRFTFQTFAIEGLQVSVQATNAVLSWPSDPSETYIVQYRNTLNATDSWQTLADYYPAFSNTNQTTFVHSNQLSFSTSFNENSSEGALLGSAAVMRMQSLPPVPLAMPADGLGAGVPISIYPPGFDFSGFTIFDPCTGDMVRGADYAIGPLLQQTRLSQDVPDPSGGPQPNGGSSGSSPAPATGFYRVVRDGVHIYGLTNGMVVSGSVSIPLEMALNSTDEVAGVTFYDGGVPLIGASAHTNAGGGWILDWNTPMSFNGDHGIYAEVDFVTDAPVTNAPVTVTVSNVISFPNYFSRVFGDWMWLYAETIPNTAYEIDLYDENTNFLGCFADYTDGSGIISFIWDLTDGNGHTFDSTNFSGVSTVDTSALNAQSKAQPGGAGAKSSGFQKLSLLPPQKALNGQVKANGMHPNAGGSSASAPQFWVKEPKWPYNNNNWVVAYGPLDNSSYNNDAAVNMIVGGMAQNGILGGVLGTLDLYGLNGNLSPGNSAQGGTVFTLSDAAHKTSLLGYLADLRYENFYFFGHGSPSAIGGYNNPPAVVHQNEIANALLNVPLSYQIQHAAMHPYRLIYIDACNAGAGNFCEAFGIPAQTVDNQFFANNGVESRAFLGFRNYKNFNVQQWMYYCEMMEGFYMDWLGNIPLQTCITNALNGAHTDNNYLKMDPSVVIYGAANLRHSTNVRP